MEDLSPDFLKSLEEIPGLDAAALAAALDTPPSVSIRLNRRKTVGTGPVVGTGLHNVGTGLWPVGGGADDRVPWCRDGRYLDARPVFTLDPLLHAGAYYVQDASSMIYQQIAERITAADAPQARPYIALDFCAAPGGKTTALINALPEGSVVVANEYVAARGKILRENLEKWGYPGVITTGSAAEQFRELPPIFDLVAVDAPCSGEGMMRKEEEARRQWSERLVEECAALQREILRDVVGTLRPGGFLIYSTCTFNIHEDEENSLFIAEELGLQPVSPEELELVGIEGVARAALPGVEALRFMPHLTRGEGIYVSVFRRPVNESTDPSIPRESVMEWSAKANPAGKSRGKNTPGDSVLTAELRSRIEQWLRPGMMAEVRGEMVTALPAEAVPVVEMLRKVGVNVTGAGLPIAEIKGSLPEKGRGKEKRQDSSRKRAGKEGGKEGGKKLELIPDSRLVLNGAMRPDAFPQVELDRETALRYLRREAIVLGEETPKGFVTVTYAGLPLGIVKNLGPRANNLYPAAWRVRM